MDRRLLVVAGIGLLVVAIFVIAYWVSPQDGLFLVASVLAVAGSVIAVTRSNPIYSLVALIVVFVSVGVIFLALLGKFMLFAQIAVYAGAILVLFLFVIMLFDLEHLKDPNIDQARSFRTLLNVRALVVSVALAVFLIVPIALGSGEFWDQFPDAQAARAAGVEAKNLSGNFAGKPVPAFGSPERVGHDIFTRYLVPFEVITLLVLAGALGALVLCMRRPADTAEAATPGPANDAEPAADPPAAATPAVDADAPSA